MWQKWLTAPLFADAMEWSREIKSARRDVDIHKASAASTG
jgi:hypothetical protein